MSASSRQSEDNEPDSDSEDNCNKPHVWSPRNPNPSPKPSPKPSPAVQDATSHAFANARSAAAGNHLQDAARPVFSPISPKKNIRKGLTMASNLAPTLPDAHSPPFAWASSPNANGRTLDYTPSLNARRLDDQPDAHRGADAAG